MISKLDIRDILDHIGSDNEEDSDDDDETISEKKRNTTNELLEYIENRLGCTTATAKKILLKKINRPLLTQLGLTSANLKKHTYTTLKGRDKAKRKVFKKVVEECRYQTQIMKILKSHSGQRSVDGMVKECWSYSWPHGFLYLYNMKICEFDKKKMKEKLGNDKNKLLKYENN